MIFYLIFVADQNTTAFKEVAIIRHPRVGEYAFGFITSTVTLQVLVFPSLFFVCLFASFLVMMILHSNPSCSCLCVLYVTYCLFQLLVHILRILITFSYLKRRNKRYNFIIPCSKC